MDVGRTRGNERMLRRVIALLVAFAVLAERVTDRSLAVRFSCSGYCAAPKPSPRHTPSRKWVSRAGPLKGLKASRSPGMARKTHGASPRVSRRWPPRFAPGCRSPARSPTAPRCAASFWTTWGRAAVAAPAAGRQPRTTRHEARRAAGTLDHRHRSRLLGALRTRRSWAPLTNRERPTSRFMPLPRDIAPVAGYACVAWGETGGVSP